MTMRLAEHIVSFAVGAMLGYIAIRAIRWWWRRSAARIRQIAREEILAALNDRPLFDGSAVRSLADRLHEFQQLDAPDIPPRGETP